MYELSKRVISLLSIRTAESCAHSKLEMQFSKNIVTKFCLFMEIQFNVSKLFYRSGRRYCDFANDHSNMLRLATFLRPARGKAYSFFKSGQSPARDAKHIKEANEKGFRLAIFIGFIFPLLRKTYGTRTDFIPSEGHKWGLGFTFQTYGF